MLSTGEQWALVLACAAQRHVQPDGASGRQWAGHSEAVTPHYVFATLRVQLQTTVLACAALLAGG